MQKRILVVDDEGYVLDVCRRILQTDYNVSIVQNGLKAIELAQQEHFDLLLTDIKMPGIDGLDTARALREINPDIVCVTMTGYSTMETAINALRLGIDEFVLKPFEPEELRSAIERALEKADLRKENIRLKSLLPLFKFNRHLMSITNTDTLFSYVFDHALLASQADGLALYLLDDRGNLKLTQSKNYSPTQLLTFEQQGLDVLGRPSELLYLEAGECTEAEGILLQQLAAKSMVVLPLTLVDENFGFLSFYKRNGRFTKSEQSFLSVLIGQATIAYKNATLFQDLQLAYDQMKSLDHLKSEFINVAAHELRTPLAILLGYANVAEEELKGTPQAEYMDSITRNGLRLQHLIDDLLNMQYIESGQMKTNAAEINFNEVVTRIIEDMSLLAKQKNIVISTELCETIGNINADQHHLDLILINLLGNAIKFTPKDGKIFVSSAIDGENLRLVVEDTGVGIPEAEFAKIFDRFYQVESSLNRHHEGIGLGLSIVKGTLARCGGDIRVVSELGKGSTFTVIMPI